MSSPRSKWVKSRSKRKSLASVPGPGSRAGQIVELAEGPGEGGLAALVGPGDDEDPLPALQVEVVATTGCFGDELARQGQIEAVADDTSLRCWRQPDGRSSNRPS